MDEGGFELYNGLVTNGWEWIRFDDYMLTEGEHTLTIAYREDGARLDKICISNAAFVPQGMGEEAENLCVETSMHNIMDVPDGYTLVQNYPNPFNPATSITYYLPQKSKVILEVLDITGRTVEILINNVETIGEHTIIFDGSGKSSGIYFYRLRTSTGLMQSKKMLLLK
jgi:hypothetical protein